MTTCLIGLALHDEHVATVAIIDRLETLIGRHSRERPDHRDSAVARMLRDLNTALGPELLRHFDFEETPIFELLASAGDAEVTAHLRAEHEIIRPLGARLLHLGAEAAAAGFGDGDWREFRAVAGELCGLLRAHVEKEENLLLPLLDETLDPETDARLRAEYAGNT